MLHTRQTHPRAGASTLRLLLVMILVPSITAAPLTARSYRHHLLLEARSHVNGNSVVSSKGWGDLGSRTWLSSGSRRRNTTLMEALRLTREVAPGLEVQRLTSRDGTVSTSDHSHHNPASSSVVLTNKAAVQDAPAEAPSHPITSPHNKLFPLFIAGTVAGSLLVCFALIACGRMCTHHAIHQEALQSGDTDRERLTSAPYSRSAAAAGGGARGLKRAKTGNGFRSFARRDTVLIEHGDEVFAVPTLVAEEYKRQQAAALSTGGPKRSIGSLLGRYREADSTHRASSDSLGLYKWRIRSVNVASAPASAPSRSLSRRFVDRLSRFGGGGCEMRGASQEEYIDDAAVIAPLGWHADAEKHRSNTCHAGVMPIITQGGEAWAIHPSADTHRTMPRHVRETPALGRPYLPPLPQGAERPPAGRVRGAA